MTTIPKLRFDKDEFLSSEFGMQMKLCLIELAINMQNHNKDSIKWYLAQWFVYQSVLWYFYGKDYEFIQTEDCCGVGTETENGIDWLYQYQFDKNMSDDKENEHDRTQD